MGPLERSQATRLEGSDNDLRDADDTFGIPRNAAGRLDLCAAYGSSDRQTPLEPFRDNLSHSRYRRVVFGDGSAQALPFGDLKFERSRFTGVRFAGCSFYRTNFRGCEFVNCDFRYARFTGVSFVGAKLASCDFYRAVFAEANLLAQTELVHVSFDNTWLLGILGLDQWAFRHKGTWRVRHTVRYKEWLDRNKEWLDRVATERKRAVNEALEVRAKAADAASNPVGRDEDWLIKLRYQTKVDPVTLVQEADEASYSFFLLRTESDRPGHYGLEAGVLDASLQASDTYRALAGLWSGQGQFDDSSFAYIQSKLLERRYLNPLHGLRRQKEVKSDRYGWAECKSWCWLLIGGSVARFGEGLSNVVAWLVGVTLLAGGLYAVLGAVTENGSVVRSLSDGILFSLQQMIRVRFGSLQPASRVVEVFGAVEVMIGIILVGLFGFVLGNRLRRS